MKMISTTTEENIDQVGDEDFDLTSSESKDSSGNSNLQFPNKPKSFTGPNKSTSEPEDSVNIPGVNTLTGVVLHQALEERDIKILFKKSHANPIKIDLNNFVLLDSQSTMDLLCNSKLVGNIYKAKKRCSFIVTEARFSSITGHSQPVTSQMYGSTKNLPPTSLPSII